MNIQNYPKISELIYQLKSLFNFDKTIQFEDLPHPMQSLKQLYPVTNIIKYGHSDGYFKTRRKTYFSGMNHYYCDIEFSINNDTIILNSIQSYSEVIRKVFPHSTYIQIGEFHYEGNSIKDLLPASNKLDTFLTKHNINRDTLITLLQQQFNTVSIK